MNPNDDDIIRDIGDCLIQTHNYHKVFKLYSHYDIMKIHYNKNLKEWILCLI